MVWRIVIDFNPEPEAITFTHQIRNFGEDVVRACRDDGWCSLSIESVDRATRQLVVDVRSARRVRRVTAMLDRILVEHFLKDRCSILAVKDE